MRRVAFAQTQCCVFAQAHYLATRWTSGSTGLGADVARVYAALEGLAQRTGHPVAVEMHSEGRFILRPCTRHQADHVSTALVDCQFHTDWERALSAFRGDVGLLRHSKRLALEARRGAHPRVGRPAPGVPVVFDLTSRAREDQHAVQFVQAVFPHLTLKIEHSAAPDVNGVRTHTQRVSVQRLPFTQEPLTSQEEEALEHFLGSADGHGFHNTLARAMRTACAAVNLQYPKAADSEKVAASCPREVSVLSLYLTLLRSHAPEATLRVERVQTTRSENATALASSSLSACVMRSEVVLARKNGTSLNGLPSLLDVIRAACETVAPTEADALAQQVSDRRLVFVLPDQHVSAKKVLLHLLSYYYGVSDEQVTFQVTRSSTCLFDCTLQVVLPLEDWMPCQGVPDITLDLERGSGLTKKAATELACAATIHTLFPDVYTEHLAAHPEFEALLASGKVAAEGLLAPPVSQGLKAQLSWACGRCGGVWECRTRRLEEGRDYPDLGVSAYRPVWCAETVVTFPAHDGHGEAATVSSSRHFVAFDSRKSRAEQKSYARTLAECFPNECQAAVNHAAASSLLDVADKNSLCPGVAALPSEDDFREALQTDRNLSAIHQLSPPFERWLVGTATAPNSAAGSAPDSPTLSLLQMCERCSSLADHGGEMQVVYNAERNQYVATACPRTPEHRERGNCVERRHWSRWAARLAVYRECARLLADESARQQLRALIQTLPTALSSATPLQDMVDAMHQLYGVDVRMRATLACKESRCEFGDVTVEIWGTASSVDADAPPHLLDGAVCPPGGDASTLAEPECLIGRRASLLARATGPSASAAAWRCCRLLLAHHVRPVCDVFPKTLLCSQTIPVTGWQGRTASALPHLMLRVCEEVRRSAPNSTVNASASDSGSTAVAALTDVVADASGGLEQLLFKVRSEETDVTLETVKGNDLLTGLLELEARIRAETASASDAHVLGGAPKRSMTFNTFEDAVRAIVNDTLGLTISVATHHDGSRWYSEMSLDLGGATFFSLCRVSASRESDAVELAASHVLRTSLAQRSEAVSVIGRSIDPQTATAELVRTAVFFRRPS